MIKRQNADGTWVEMTEAEAWEDILAESIALYGEEEGRKDAEKTWRDLHTPGKARSEMTEGERNLSDRMQAEHEMSVTLARGGYKSILDLPGGYDSLPDPLAPREDDDREVEIDLHDAREYDHEGASADLAARQAREKARREREGS